ncbi:hypothetical protein [Aeromonas veronii]|uniref:hypothetical protein n=1 Tax=Aeromonas veronii TaxID=654 RepID=UPI0011162C37|nr:hypothetical protein [Aeromonas veronii]
MRSDNPAARLLAILKQGKEQNGDFNTKIVWSSILSIADDDVVAAESLLMAKLGQVMLLPHETQILVSRYYPELSRDLIHAMSKLQDAFTRQNLSGTWSSFINHIDIHCISTLSLTASLLDNKLETRIIDKDSIDSFRIRVQALISDALNIELDKDFKKFIVHYLQKILTALNDYLISGAQPILDALEATLGHAVLDPDFKGHLKENGFGKTVREFIGDLANVVTVATAATGAVAYISANGFPLLN